MTKYRLFKLIESIDDGKHVAKVYSTMSDFELTHEEIDLVENFMDGYECFSQDGDYFDVTLLHSFVDCFFEELKDEKNGWDIEEDDKYIYDETKKLLKKLEKVQDYDYGEEIKDEGNQVQAS